MPKSTELTRSIGKLGRTFPVHCIPTNPPKSLRSVGEASAKRSLKVRDDGQRRSRGGREGHPIGKNSLWY